MIKGVSTFIVPVQDLARAKAQYKKLLGVEPNMDAPYYVNFHVGDLDIGLDPNGPKQGMTAPVTYFLVSDIKATLQGLTEAGAQIQQTARDVGGGKLIATVKDTEGNLLGFIQLP
jgi:predicted enzyme related to lactoylglutathione lyase